MRSGRRRRPNGCYTTCKPERHGHRYGWVAGRTGPGRVQPGAELFKANCVACHGEAALGTHQGPPLVHIYYEPIHHADIAFYMAAGRGVKAHHWNFSDMPPVSGLSQAEVTEIVAYVRWLQREAGVY